MHTKNGRPLSVSGADIYDERGRQVARISGNKAFSPSGRYVGTIVGDRLIYRATDSASIGGAFAPGVRAASAQAPSAGSADWGEEPRFD